MIFVVHFDSKDPEIHFDATKAEETKVLGLYRKQYDISRSSSEDWPGQDNPRYAVYHWDARKRR